MKKINEHLDPANQAHAVVIAINERNEALYGKIQDCGLFKAFCRCEQKEKERSER